MSTASPFRFLHDMRACHRAVLLPIIFLLLPTIPALPTNNPCTVDTSVLLKRTKSAIYHAYASYKHNALPFDELQPLSCSGIDTFNGLSITLVDTLDTFIILHDWPEFIFTARYIRDSLTFDRNITVSVFETTIRVLGGLLSAHGFLVDGFEDTGFDAWLWWPDYDNSLLYLAELLADTLLPAFNTPTRIPYGAINLRYGVADDESIIASTAGAGSLLLEFGTLARYTGRDTFYDVAFQAMKALHDRAADTALVGNHINILTGEWVATESGIGGLIDSFYEYMLKGYILFGDYRLLKMYQTSYKAVSTYLRKDAWYLDADMWTGRTISLSHSALSAFFPGLQVLMGLHHQAEETTRAHYSVWRRFGCLPEGFDVSDGVPSRGRVNYPLRPELVESVFYLHWATNDPVWIRVAQGVLQGLENVARVDCGFARVRNVNTHTLDDVMDSFLISETLKYVYLTLLPSEHWTRSGRYVFTTEAHPLRIYRGSHDMREGHRWKCRRSTKGRLPCGFGLSGRDIVRIDINDLRHGNVAKDVAEQVEKVVKQFGMNSLDVGRLFVGEKSRYRVVRIVDQEVFFAKLAGDYGECGRRWGREVVKAVCVWRR